MILMTLEKFFERNVVPKIQNSVETVLLSLPEVLLRQLDSMIQTNINENDIDIFPGQTNIRHKISQFLYHWVGLNCKL